MLRTNPERLWKITATYGPDDDPMMWEEATIDEVLAWVRRGVESGTIEGEVVKRMCVEHRAWLGNSDLSTVCGIYSYVRLYQGRPNPCKIVERLVMPVSDGGSET